MADRLAELEALYVRDPSDEALAVLTDAWLEAGDPRGALVAAQTRSEIAAAFAECVEPVLSRLPDPKRVRFENGFVAEVALSVTNVAKLQAEFASAHPLAVLSIEELAEIDEDAIAALTAAVRSLRGLFGLRIGMMNDALWPALRVALDACKPALLSVDTDAEQLPDQPWPWVRALELSGANPDTTAGWISCCPELRALQMSDIDLPDALWHHANLEHLDIRGSELEASEREKLATWISETGGSVRHELFTLSPPASGRDWFGDGGHTWPVADQRRRAAFRANSEEEYVLSDGARVVTYTRDTPERKHLTSAPITALAVDAERAVWGHADGLVGSSLGSLSLDLDSPIREIDLRGDDVLVLTDTALVLRIEGRETTRDRVFDAAAFAGSDLVVASGSAVIAGSQRYELGSEVRALAADGGRIAAVAGTRVWLLDGDEVRMLGTCASDARAAVAFAGDTIGWITGPTSVAVSRAGAITTCVYPGTYSSGFANPLRVADIDVTSGGAVVCVLENGGANLLLPGAAMKVDPFPGEADGSWIFIYNGEILMA